MELETKEETFICVDYNDLDKFINYSYSREDFYFVAEEECGNYTNIIFNVTGELSKWDVEDVRKFGSGENSSPGTRALLNDLCKQGKIKPGMYLIKVYW